MEHQTRSACENLNEHVICCVVLWKGLEENATLGINVDQFKYIYKYTFFHGECAYLL